MKRTIFALALVFASSGCDNSDGDRLARVGRMVASKLQALIPEKTPFGVTFSIAKNGPEDQVRERFRLDAFLAQIPFDIVAEGANIRLKATVDNDALKKRAIEIAETTVGVEKVIDEITVGKQ